MSETRQPTLRDGEVAGGAAARSLWRLLSNGYLGTGRYHSARVLEGHPPARRRAASSPARHAEIAELLSVEEPAPGSASAPTLQTAATAIHPPPLDAVSDWSRLADLGERSRERRPLVRPPLLELRRSAPSPCSTTARISGARDIAKTRLSSSQLRFFTSSTEVGIFGSVTSASPTRPRPSRSNVSTALIRAPWSGTEISCRKPLPHSGQVHVAHVSRVVLVAASSRTRRIVSTSSAAVRASAGRTAEGDSARPCSLQRLGLRDHRQALPGVPCLRVVAVRDGHRRPSSDGERGVVRAELAVGRNGAARGAVSELRAAERG